MSESTRFEELFHAARQLETPEDRAAFLAQNCGDSPEMRRELERLLAADAVAGAFLDRPAAEVIPTVDHASHRSSAESDREARGLVGTSIGPYKLLELIGEGGMGVVYMAEQRTPLRRLVALKVVKPGLDTRQVVARFEAERQALAMMDHPNIARVIDAGATASGRPFFVMELVRGVPITDYCDTNQLTVPARLELFGQVCHAVQHAHQKGIIHRDIKPSNVLVTLHDGVPVPKVIDFGVAKATNQQLTEKTLFTHFAQMVGTPLYMSPEQAEMSGLDVDTRSDIYSLGVLLYELLTGTTPFDRETLRKAAYDEVRRIIREQEPPRPSARISTLGETRTTVAMQRQLNAVRLSQLVRGELDWIVMKSLEKDRTRRYETANAFAADIARFLADQPVEAGPPSTVYRVRKFARRNRSLLTTTVTLAGILVLATFFSSWQAIRAKRAERQAEKQATIAQSSELKAQQERRRADAKAEEAESREREANAERARAEQNAQEANAERIRADEKAQEVLAEKEAVRRLAYAATTNAAQLAWEANRIDRVHQLLEAQIPQDGERDLRGWEWHYQRRLCEDDLRTFRGHTNRVRCVAFSPDGRRLASGSQDKTIKIWDADTGAELHTLRGHMKTVWCVVFSPNGQRLASACEDDTLKVWDANTGAELLTLRGHTKCVNSVVFSPDGQRLASASDDDTLRIWDANTGTELHALRRHANEVWCVVFSPDGQRLASAAYDETLKIWDAYTGAELHTLRGHTDAVNSVVFSPDGQRLASASDDETLKLWDANTGAELQTLRGHADGVWCVAFSPDGHSLASASYDKTITIWDANSGASLRTLKGHTDSVNCVAFSPDSGKIASAGSDGTIKLWESQHAGVRTFPRRGVACTVFSPDGRPLTYHHHGKTIELWDVESGTQLRTLKMHGFPGHNALSRDGSTLAAEYGRTISVLDTEDGTLLRAFSTGHTDFVADVAFSPDGDRIASAGHDTTIKLWEVESGMELHTLKGHTNTVLSVAFSPDGRRLASGSTDKTVKLWDANTGTELLTLQRHTGKVNSVVFSPDGRCLASASADETIKIWDANSGVELRTLKAHVSDVEHIAFSPDGRRLVSADSNRTIKIWDPVSGVELYTLLCDNLDDTGSVYVDGVAFSPDGRWLAITHFNSISLYDSHVPTEDVKMAQCSVRQLCASLMDPDLVAAEIAAHNDWPDTMRQAGLEYLRRVSWPRLEAQLRFEKAIVAIERSDWQDAARQLNRRIELAEGGGELPDLLGSLALLELLNGNTEAYRQACDRLGHADRDWRLYPIDCEGIVAISCAGEASLEFRSELLNELEQRLQEKPWYGWYQLMVWRMGILYREHRFEQILGSLDDTEAEFTDLGRSSSYRWMRIPHALFLAMAYHQLGHAEEARKWLAIGQEAHDQLLSDVKQRPVGTFCYLRSVLNDSDWQCRALLSQLRKEAETLITPTANEPPSPAMP